MKVTAHFSENGNQWADSGRLEQGAMPNSWVLHSDNKMNGNHVLPLTGRDVDVYASGTLEDPIMVTRGCDVLVNKFQK